MFKYVFIFLFSFVSALSFAEEINWQSYDDARALQSDKPIFVFAKMRFCSTCAKMESDEFTDPELIALLNEHFIPVVETNNFAFSQFAFEDLKDKEGKPLKFRGFPSILLIKGQDYSLSQGYVTAETLKKELRKVVMKNG